MINDLLQRWIRKALLSAFAGWIAKGAIDQSIIEAMTAVILWASVFAWGEIESRIENIISKVIKANPEEQSRIFNKMTPEAKVAATADLPEVKVIAAEKALADAVPSPSVVPAGKVVVKK